MADRDTRGTIERATDARVADPDPAPAGPASEVVTPPERDPELGSLLQELDLTDSQSILFFGSKAQQQLTAVSDRMLEGVRNKDVGPAGASLNDMVATLRGFDVEGLDPEPEAGPDGAPLRQDQAGGQVPAGVRRGP